MIVDGVCTIGDLPPASCGHCRGLSVPNMDSARVVIEEPAPRTVRVSARRTGKMRLMGLAQLVQQTAVLYADLEDALHGTRTGEPGQRPSGSTEAPLPLQADVAEHRHLLVRGLRYWCAKVDATPRVLVSEDVPRMAAWIIHGLPQLTPEQQTELRDNLEDWRAGVTSRVDLPKLRTAVPLGPGTCPSGTTGVWTCPGELQLLVSADRNRAPWLQCRDCRTRYAVTELPDAANVRLPLADAAEVTGVPLSTIKGWLHYGDLEPVARGPLQVLLGDVLARVSA